MKDSSPQYGQLEEYSVILFSSCSGLISKEKRGRLQLKQATFSTRTDNTPQEFCKIVLFLFRLALQQIPSILLDKARLTSYSVEE